MKRVFLSLLAAATVMLAGCHKEPESSTKRGNFKVEKLFTDSQGCTVSRFYDGQTVYYTNCVGQTSKEESCGKNCTYTDIVMGGRNE